MYICDVKLKSMTKIKRLIKNYGWTQSDLRREIYDKTGFLMGRDRICKIVNGITFNYNVETALMLSWVLNVDIDDIVEKKLLPYNKQYSKNYVTPNRIKKKLNDKQRGRPIKIKFK